MLDKQYKLDTLTSFVCCATSETVSLDVLQLTVFLLYEIGK